jgi:hypothetical protein
MAVLIVSLLVIGVIIGIAVIWGRGKVRQRTRAYAVIAERMGGTAFGKERVQVTVDGLLVTMLPALIENRRQTHYIVDLPGQYPLALLVRPHARGDAGKIARGEMVDIRIGDLAFDDAFLVEAAPADVAKLLLDGETRAWLASLPSPELSKPIDGVPQLRLVLPEWNEDPDEAERHFRGVARVASRVREAYATADAAIPTQQTGAPFREEIDDEARQRAARQREDEVSRVQRVQVVRRRREQLIAGVATGIAVGAYILIRFWLR